MNQAMFNVCMKPVTEYYNKSLSADEMDLYYVELSRHPEKKLKSVLHSHMANAKFFPKVVELKKRLGVYDDNGKEHSDLPEDHREFVKHRRIAESMLESRINGGTVTVPENYTFLIDINQLVDHCFEVYEKTELNPDVVPWYAENKRISRANAVLNHILPKLFAQL